MEPKHSPLGIISFVISIAAGFLIIVTFVVAGLIHNSHPGQHPYPGQTLVGLAIMGLIAAELIAAVLGLVSLFLQGKKRLFGVLGLVISSITLLATIALMIFGLMIAGKIGR